MDIKSKKRTYTEIEKQITQFLIDNEQKRINTAKKIATLNDKRKKESMVLSTKSAYLDAYYGGVSFALKYAHVKSYSKKELMGEFHLPSTSCDEILKRLKKRDKIDDNRLQHQKLYLNDLNLNDQFFGETVSSKRKKNPSVLYKISSTLWSESFL